MRLTAEAGSQISHDYSRGERNVEVTPDAVPALSPPTPR